MTSTAPTSTPAPNANETAVKSAIGQVLRLGMKGKRSALLSRLRQTGKVGHGPVARWPC